MHQILCRLGIRPRPRSGSLLDPKAPSRRIYGASSKGGPHDFDPAPNQKIVPARLLVCTLITVTAHLFMRVAMTTIPVASAAGQHQYHTHGVHAYWHRTAAAAVVS